MIDNFKILPLKEKDIAIVTEWAKSAGFTPGIGDINIYRHTDQQGLWIGWLGDKPIGSISGVKYNSGYGFIGLFYVIPKYRGKGYGLCLWKHALSYLKDILCIGLEAAPERIQDYAKWGFLESSITTRWQFNGETTDKLFTKYHTDSKKNINLLEGSSIPTNVVQQYDAKKESTARPHFLSDWLNNPAGNVLALVDNFGECKGFGRIRPCLLENGNGWRIGPLLADSPHLAEILFMNLIYRHSSPIFVDSPGLNPNSSKLLSKMSFRKISKTIRMYKGVKPNVCKNEIYGLACLELG